MNMATVDLKKFRNEVELALAAVAEKYGCEVAAGNIKYDTTSVDIAVYFKSKGENGESAEEVDFKKHCKDYGFSMEDYGMKFTLDGKTYRLIGFNPRARKNSCIITDSNGKQYACPPSTVFNAGGGR